MGEVVKLIATPQSFPCARIEWALRIKGVEYEYILEDIVNNLNNKSALLLESNPVHKKVPVLLHNGKPIAESLVILEYIDETWNDINPLLPQDPSERALARFWARFMDDKCLPDLWRATVAQGEEKKKAVDAAIETLAFLEKQIQGKKFFGGEKIGYLDIAAGWIYWLNAVEELGEIELVNAERFPCLHEWGKTFINASPIKDCLPPREDVVAYLSFGVNYVRSMEASKS